MPETIELRVIGAGDPQLGNQFRLHVSCSRASGRGEAAWTGERGVLSTLGIRPVHPRL